MLLFAENTGCSQEAGPSGLNLEKMNTSNLLHWDLSICGDDDDVSTSFIDKNVTRLPRSSTPVENNPTINMNSRSGKTFIFC